MKVGLVAATDAVAAALTGLPELRAHSTVKYVDPRAWESSRGALLAVWPEGTDPDEAGTTDVYSVPVELVVRWAVPNPYSAESGGAYDSTVAAAALVEVEALDEALRALVNGLDVPGASHLSVEDLRLEPHDDGSLWSAVWTCSVEVLA